MSEGTGGSPREPLPTPTREYDNSYMNRLISSIEYAIEQLLNPGPVQTSSLTLIDVPTNGSSLDVNQVFSDGGILRVVREGDVYAPSFTATVYVGTVTVTTA
jgi:hypothetical protein